MKKEKDRKDKITSGAKCESRGDVGNKMGEGKTKWEVPQQGRIESSRGELKTLGKDGE